MQRPSASARTLLQHLTSRMVSHGCTEQTSVSTLHAQKQARARHNREVSKGPVWLWKMGYTGAFIIDVSYSSTNISSTHHSCSSATDSNIALASTKGRTRAAHGACIQCVVGACSPTSLVSSQHCRLHPWPGCFCAKSGFMLRSDLAVSIFSIDMRSSPSHWAHVVFPGILGRIGISHGPDMCGSNRIGGGARSLSAVFMANPA